MNTRPKSQGGEAGNFKQQPKRTIAAATGAPRREDAMLAATEPVQKQARHVLERAFESIELSFRAAKLGTVAVNRKLIDIARTNVSRRASIWRLGLPPPRHRWRRHSCKWRFSTSTLRRSPPKAQEHRALHAEIVAITSEPLREHVRRS